MKKIVRKFHCRRGASITIAMLLFLLCALAGVSALTMAAANAGRYSHAEEDRQPYYSVTSAALFVADVFDGLKYTSATINFDYTHSWTFHKDETPQRTYTDEYSLNILTGNNTDGYEVNMPVGKIKGSVREVVYQSRIALAIRDHCDDLVPYLSVPQEWYSSVDKSSNPVTPTLPDDLYHSFTIKPDNTLFGVVECTLVMKANYDLLFSFLYKGDSVGDSYAINLYWAATVSESPEKGVPEYNYTGDGNTGSVTEKQSKKVEITWEKANVKISRGEADKIAG